MSDINGLTIDSNGVSFDTVSDVDSEFCELVSYIFENLNGEQKRSNQYLDQLRDEERVNRKLTIDYQLLTTFVDCLFDSMQDKVDYNTDYNLINEITHLETQVQGLESDVRTYQNHQCEATCPEICQYCGTIAVTVDDTWEDTKPEMGIMAKPPNNNRIFS